MKACFGVAVAILAGMVIGAAAVEGLHAQAKPPVYLIGEIDVTNPEGYAKEYLPKAREIIKQHGGQVVAAGGAAGSGTPVMPSVVRRRSASSSIAIQA